MTNGQEVFILTRGGSPRTTQFSIHESLNSAKGRVPAYLHWRELPPDIWVTDPHPGEDEPEFVITRYPVES